MAIWGRDLGMGRGSCWALGVATLLCALGLLAGLTWLGGPRALVPGPGPRAPAATENPTREGGVVSTSPNPSGDSHSDRPDSGPSRSSAADVAAGDTAAEADSAPVGSDESRRAAADWHAAAPDDPYAAQRMLMVENQMRRRGITDVRVLEAMQRVPRHAFVPHPLRDLAYADQPLPIGKEQTISQPYIVAFMTQLVRPHARAKALDVGTGTGYQAAVLAELCEHVFTIEIVEELANQARPLLDSLGYDNITCRHGDGYAGWPEEAPFDVIVVAAAPDHVPPLLLDQLAVGGRLVIPVGQFSQELILVEKRQDGTLRQQSVAAVAFVPMTGQAQQ